MSKAHRHAFDAITVKKITHADRIVYYHKCSSNFGSMHVSVVIQVKKSFYKLKEMANSRLEHKVTNNSIILIKTNAQ